jgi:hypothetical protein
METQVTEVTKLKIAHDHCVVAHQIITTRTQFYTEEFEAVKGCADFLREMAMKLKGQIETLEPKETNEQTKAGEQTVVS